MAPSTSDCVSKPRSVCSAHASTRPALSRKYSPHTMTCRLHGKSAYVGLNLTQLSSNRRRSRIQVAAVTTEGFTGFTYFMRPEFATVFSALIAVGSVILNLYGGIVMEQRRAELKQQMDQESDFLRQQRELQSILARYRGPLLESLVDLEQRFFHIVNQVDEWCVGDLLREEEVVHTLFVMSQFLGYLEVVRREGPRERSFLQKGNPQGSDTLAAWVEGFRFVLAADHECLQNWYDDVDPSRAHPGVRRRRLRQGLDREPGSATASRDGAASDNADDGVVFGHGNLLVQSTAGRPSFGWSSAAATVDRNGQLNMGSSRMDLLGGTKQWSAGPLDGVVVPLSAPPSVDEPPTLGGSGGVAFGSKLGSGMASVSASASSNGRGGKALVTGDSSSGDGAQQAALGRSGTSAALVGVAVERREDAASRSQPEAGPGPLPHHVATSADKEHFRDLWCEFRMSRGTQRAVGSLMILTPSGAERHYTMSYGEFYLKIRSDPYFAGWLRPLYEDISLLVAAKRVWRGEHVFPVHSHTRLLLMQHLLVDAMDFLDPTFIRVPAVRRVRLCPIVYDELPNLSGYKKQLEELELVFARANGNGHRSAMDGASDAAKKPWAPGS